MFCPACGKENQNGAKFCQSCGKNVVEAAGGVFPPAVVSVSKTVVAFEKPHWTKQSIGCSGCLKFFMIGGLILFIVGLFQAGPPPDRPYTGEDGHTASAAFVGVDSTSFGELRKAKLANDDHGVRELILRDKVFAIEKGTKIKVLEVGFETSTIRILDGPYAGRKGIVQNKAVGR
ncbi:MAG: hypothetical protein AMXMBFR33_01930 [Candidatus Xenobia bacterium]